MTEYDFSCKKNLKRGSFFWLVEPVSWLICTMNKQCDDEEENDKTKYGCDKGHTHNFDSFSPSVPFPIWGKSEGHL